MTRVFRKIYEEGAEDGKTEGIAETKQEDMKIYLESRFGTDSSYIKDKLDDISNIEVLNSLIAKLYKAETIHQVEKLIDQAVEKQHIG